MLTVAPEVESKEQRATCRRHSIHSRGDIVKPTTATGSADIWCHPNEEECDAVEKERK